jgi:hypothetical protein
MGSRSASAAPVLGEYSHCNILLPCSYRADPAGLMGKTGAAAGETTPPGLHKNHNRRNRSVALRRYERYNRIARHILTMRSLPAHCGTFAKSARAAKLPHVPHGKRGSGKRASLPRAAETTQFRPHL